MPEANPYEANAVTEALIKQRQLSTRDANLARSVQMSPTERAADLAGDFTPANILELVREIENTADPARRAILMQELDRIKGQMSTMLGPRPDTNSALPMRPVFRPGVPAEQPDRPQMTVPIQPPPFGVPPPVGL